MKHQQPVAHDSTCVAARTRPLLSCRRRRLIQPSTVTNLNGKVSASAVTQDRSCVRASLPQTRSGISCFGWLNKTVICHHRCECLKSGFKFCYRSWPSWSFSASLWSSCRTDASTLSSTGPERRRSLRLQGELQLCDVQWPAHTQRRASVWAAHPGAPVKAGSWRPPHPLIPWRSVLRKSVYAAISCFTSKGEDKQGGATDGLLYRKLTRHFINSTL